MDVHLPATHRIPVASGVHLNAWVWPGGGVSFLLVHGLSSNARTWDAVAGELAAAGHTVVAVDQRGHGRSDKPDDGYDFATVAGDLATLIQALGLDRPVVAGQSWGGNVVLELAARRPDLVRLAVGVDGGTIALGDAFPRWETCAAALAPPRLAGMRLADLRARLTAAHPDWPAAGIAATLDNFEHLPDGTVRPWLTYERHMTVLRHLYEHRPADLYPRLAVPVLLVGALGREPLWDPVKRARIAAAARTIAVARAVFYEPADHDLHVQQPDRLARLLGEALDPGFFS
jgi:pimeloyl-ACP methyl ester carboxylesterase